MIKWLVLASCCLVVVHAQSEILFRFLNLDRESLSISDNCNNDLDVMKDNLDKREIWALKLLDASAHPAPSFSWGNSYWMGSEFSCMLLNQRPEIYLANNEHRRNYPNLTDITSPMPVEFRIFYVRYNSKMQLDLDIYNKTVLHVGLCFPQSCTNEDSFAMGNLIFQKKHFADHSLIGDMELESSKNLKKRKGFYTEPFILILSISTSICLLLNIIGSSYTFYRRNFVTKKSAETSKQGCLGKFISNFCMYENSKEICTTKINKNVIPTLNGIRAVCMIWLIIFHICPYGFAAIDNLPVMFAYATVWILQPLFSASVSVDSFFVISAFLMSYSFHESQKKNPTQNATKGFLKTVYNRFIRLTPVYMFVLVMAGALSTFQNDTSAFYQNDNNEANCKMYWWRNLLYIQNLWPITEMCMTWSWYVATDFQLYFLACLLQLVYLKSKKLCVAISIGLAVAAASYSGYLGYVEVFGFSHDNQYKALDSLYTKPYTRVGVFMVGYWAGWYFSKINRNFKVSQRTNIAFWVGTFTIINFMIFIQHFQEPMPIVGALYSAFGRTTWSLATTYIILACTSGYGGFVAKFLHSKFFVPLSRISYSSYLLNPLLYLVTILSCEKPFHLDLFTLPILLPGFLLVLHLVSFIFTVLIESPITKTVSYIVKK